MKVARIEKQNSHSFAALWHSPINIYRQFILWPYAANQSFINISLSRGCKLTPVQYGRSDMNTNIF